ncbi:hypothetical protein MVEN_00091700 [Mycena venus]|uniref:HTH CENPB-type domain-containing protein n=1 Tax=Mycena venus TaxID=2733690 RepID=A0A8H6Z4A5_9AGAR|nr:hypothetical protein MVEN_00091700 [Mycena venus]
MVSRVKSNRVKGHENSRRKELNVKATLHEYEREQVKPAEFGKAKSIKAIAESHKVPYATLHRRIHGGRSIGEANQEKQKLTVVQEWSLVQFILEAAERGFPLSHAQIVQYANAVRQATLEADCEGVGVKWVFAFLDRHHHELRPFWSKALDTQRTRSLNPEAVKSWVALVQKYVVDMGVSPDRIYGMDESGFPTGYTGKERVIGAWGTKMQHKQGGASRQNITALVTIRSDGKMVVPPMIIFPGVNFQTAWGNGNTIKAFIAKSVNGWTNGELGYLWLTKVFDPATKAEANGPPRVLLLDGHSSHYTEKFINFARANNIILLGYPPHCTHALQGLDVVCFAKMKSCWQSKIVAFEAEKMREVSKAEFLSVWAPAYVEAFDESTVRGAFKVTGVVPFNPNFVTEEQMKPSVVTSTRAEFPMPQPSAVKAIVDAMRVHPPMQFDLSPSHLASGTPTPQTPTGRRPRDDDDELVNIDPALLSPSKRVQTLYAHLGCSSAASLLLSSPKIKSYNNPILAPVIQHVPRAVPTPDWSLTTPGSSKDPYKTRGQLEAEIVELQKQLALAHQNVEVRDQIIEEGNVCLSSDEFFEALKEIETNRSAREAGKEAKKVERQRKKEAREEVEKEWAEMKRKHAVLVEAWEKECAGLTELGTKKKDLPSKPKLGKKPQLPAIDDEEEDVEEELMENDG